VTEPWPEQLRADGHCLIVLERVLLAAAPEEGCALLLGQQRGTTLLLQRIWPCCNRWEPAAERPRRFQLDPREQLLAQRWARDRHLQVIGAAHSHPQSAAVPSSTDLELAFCPTLMLIGSGLGRGPQAFGAWLIPAAMDGERQEPQQLRLDVSP
jgi:proteasome lid subunit RPN8/RPN11